MRQGLEPGDAHVRVGDQALVDQRRQGWVGDAAPPAGEVVRRRQALGVGGHLAEAIRHANAAVGHVDPDGGAGRQHEQGGAADVDLPERGEAEDGRGEDVAAGHELGDERLRDIALPAAERAGRIIRRVREFVKKSEPRRSPVALAGIVEDAIGFVEVDARRHAAQVVSEIPPDLPPVFADAVMIEQVVLNLLKNGIEAMRDTPPDERIVTLGAIALPDGLVEVSVADRGHGLGDDALDKLFSPFYTTKSEGMGMGLNICRSIAELHRGRLGFESRPGGGTIFNFSLPVTPP